MKPGIKSVTMLVSGKHAYGLLKAEKGCAPISENFPFDSNARRHTSFASVSVTPQFSEANTIEINDEDLRIDTYRSGARVGKTLTKSKPRLELPIFQVG